MLDYDIEKVHKFNIIIFLKIANILYSSGKNMYKKYNIAIWRNCYLKTLVILTLCYLKNEIFVLKEKNKIVATFQLKMKSDSLFFEKLSTSNLHLNKGYGTICINEIEKIARLNNYNSIICEVYENYEVVKDFYFKRGFNVIGNRKTNRYSLLILKKDLIDYDEK